MNNYANKDGTSWLLYLQIIIVLRTREPELAFLSNNSIKMAMLNDWGIHF